MIFKHRKETAVTICTETRATLLQPPSKRPAARSVLLRTQVTLDDEQQCLFGNGCQCVDPSHQTASCTRLPELPPCQREPVSPGAREEEEEEGAVATEAGGARRS